jgi:hypothetical protein
MIAQFMREIGYNMGGDLNGANDNLWFTLLFKRPDVLIEPRHSFAQLADVFYRRMGGSFAPDELIKSLVMEIASRPRPQHSAEWLKVRAEALLRHVKTDDRVLPWGWKEPNTHVLIDRFLDFDRELRYIHVVRNGLDLAFSENQNQLRLWGSIFLGRMPMVTPRESLAYWCAVHRRMRTMMHHYEGRIMQVEFDRFCIEPQSVCREIVAFVGREAPKVVIDKFAATVTVPDSVGQFRRESTANFEPGDVAYVAECGFPVS